MKGEPDCFGIFEIPLRELLALWEELTECVFGVNSYGSDTCELYAYRFVGVSQFAWEHRRLEVSLQCASALHGLLAYFLSKHDGYAIFVEGRPFGEWVATEPFEWRVHVRVVSRE